MQCFICVTYMFFIATAHPGANREPSNQPEKRSLFRDVIESLRIRSQLPEDYNHENNLAQTYNQYGYDREQQLPSDADFVHRRNDRIEMPPLKHRFPKKMNISDDDVTDAKEEIVVYINTTTEPKPTTQKPQKKRTRPPANKNKIKKDEIDESTQKPEEMKPLTNNMAGQSHIGNRESQMVVKPTVIVNLRGSVSYSDGEIKIEGRKVNETIPIPNVPQNIFNINQEIKLERTFSSVGSNGGKRQPDREKAQEKQKIEEDMMMCETATWNPEKNREGRKFGNVLQILFSL